MSLLVSLVDMKSYLGVTNTDYDVFLTEQLGVISEAVENYCGRIFAQDTYTQTFYSDERTAPEKSLYLFHYPVSNLGSVEINGVDISDRVRLQGTKGKITSHPIPFFARYEEELVVVYTAGYATIPLTIQSVVKSLVEERYNKKVAGLDLNFGRDVQSISIPGTINVAFDYTLQANDRKNAFGILLGDYTNVLDFYRSERTLVGEIGTNYVES
jgi:hypothetical protein